MDDVKFKRSFGIFFIGVILFSIGIQDAQATTFPVDQAGIAAYVKLDSVNISDLTEAISHFYSMEQTNTTFVIGTVEIDATGPTQSSKYYAYPHVYLGLDGWIVAYYLKNEEASRIMQWKGYINGTINTTTLKDAIDTMCANMGVTYSTPLKYYDFEFPEANKITVVAETIQPWCCGGSSSNSFSVTVPGTLYEGSYSIYNAETGSYSLLDLKSDNQNVFNSSTNTQRNVYGYYNLAQLSTDVPHLITFHRDEKCISDGASTVLIYKGG